MPKSPLISFVLVARQFFYKIFPIICHWKTLLLSSYLASKAWMMFIVKIIMVRSYLYLMKLINLCTWLALLPMNINLQIRMNSSISCKLNQRISWVLIYYEGIQGESKVFLVQVTKDLENWECGWEGSAPWCINNHQDSIVPQCMENHVKLCCQTHN